MTLAEFKAWLDEFSHTFHGAPDRVQWEAIKTKLDSVTALPAPQRDLLAEAQAGSQAEVARAALYHGLSRQSVRLGEGLSDSAGAEDYATLKGKARNWAERRGLVITDDDGA